MAKTQQLGNYPANTAIATGGNFVLTPSTVPIAVNKLLVQTSFSFQGSIIADPVSGKIYVTNAYPAGTYTFLIKGYNGIDSVVKSVNVTVQNNACGKGKFSFSTNFNAGRGANALAITDVNNDTTQDLLIPLVNENRVAVRFGDGKGGFIVQPEVPVGEGPGAIVTSDFNNDGNIDFATANYLDDSISIRLGNGVGQFSELASFRSGPFPVDIAKGDFNRDGFTDLAVVNTGADSISIHLGDGLGNFSNPINLSTGASPSSIIVVDVNADGKDDIIGAHSGINEMWVWLGDGTGQFAAPSTFGVGNGARSLLVADFNNDGKPDAATANNDDATVSIKLGSGTGQFATAATVNAGAGVFSIAAADFNIDGFLDVICANSDASTVSVLLGNGTGQFPSNKETSAPSGLHFISLGDFNEDGLQDVAITNGGNNNITILGGAFNEIAVKGNDNFITDGDNTPSLTDHTDFGSLFIGSNTLRSFTIFNTGIDSLRITAASISGPHASSFVLSNLVLPLVIPPLSSANFDINFSFSTLGEKNAVLTITNDDCNEAIFDFSLHATQVNAPGAALQLDGVDDYLSLTKNTTGNFESNDFTISAWVKTASSTSATIMAKRNNCATENYFDFGINANGILYAIFSQEAGVSQFLEGNIAVNDGSWHHVAVVRRALYLSLFVDGKLDLQLETSGIANLNNDAALTIGGFFCNTINQPFNGRMDEVRIWEKALGLCDINNSMLCQINASQGGLLMNLSLNSGVSGQNNTAITQATDASGKANHAQLNNFSLTGTLSNFMAPGAIVSSNACSNLNGFETIWLGITSDWNNPANWSRGYVPIACSDVIIGNTAIYPIISGTENTCHQLKLTNGATFHLADGAKLNITGPF